VLEDNACAYTCNVAVPRASTSDFVDTLNSLALEKCSACDPPERSACLSPYPYCFGGGCVDLSYKQ